MPAQRRRPRRLHTTVGLGLLVAASLVGLTGLASCAEPVHRGAQPAVTVEPGRRLVELGAGVIGGTGWRADVVSDGGRLCVSAQVGADWVGRSCDLTLVGGLAVNFALDGDDRAVVVYGVAATGVTHLWSVTTSAGAPTEVPLHPIPQDATCRCAYFAYAAAPKTAIDLIAVDAAGTQIYSGAAKLRDAQNPS